MEPNTDKSTGQTLQSYRAYKKEKKQNQKCTTGTEAAIPPLDQKTLAALFDDFEKMMGKNVIGSNVRLQEKLVQSLQSIINSKDGVEYFSTQTKLTRQLIKGTCDLCLL